MAYAAIQDGVRFKPQLRGSAIYMDVSEWSPRKQVGSLETRVDARR